MLNEDIFDLSKTDDEIPEHVDAELVSSPEEFEEMSLTVENECKRHLSNVRKQVMLEIDKRKLKEANKFIDSQEFLVDVLSDPKVWKEVRENTKTAQDIKFLADASAKILESYRKLIRMDSLDGFGNAATLNLSIQFGGDGESRVQNVIEVTE